MKKVLIYISVGLGVATLTYYIIGGGKNTSKEEKENSESNEPQQSKPDTPLTEAINKNKIVGKTIKTKVNDVKIRTLAEANDGIANNIYGVVAKSNTQLGKVVRSYSNPKSSIKNPATGKPYVWLSFAMNEEVYNEIQSNLNFLTRDLFKNIPPPQRTWVREDTVKL
jgi:hypothetical protein